MNKYSLMHGAALYGNVGVLQYLNQIKADKIKRNKEASIIRQAIYGGRLNSVKELIEQGHDPLEKSKLIYTQYQYAIQRGDFRMVDYLSGMNRYLKHESPKGGNSLDVAVSSLRPAIFDMIAQKTKDAGVKLKVDKIRPKTGTYANLFYSNCAMGNLELARAMLREDLNINTSIRGNAAIKAAVQSGNAELVQFLIEQGGKFSKNIWEQ